MIMRRADGSRPAPYADGRRIDLRRHASVLGIDALADRNVTIR
jgi:hypothetical protein